MRNAGLVERLVASIAFGSLYATAYSGPFFLLWLVLGSPDGAGGTVLCLLALAALVFAAYRTRYAADALAFEHMTLRQAHRASWAVVRANLGFLPVVGRLFANPKDGTTLAGQVPYVVLVAIGVVMAGIAWPVVRSAGDRSAVRGYQALSEGRFEEAARAFEASIRRGLFRLEAKEAYTALGNAYGALGELGRSIDAHKKALEIDPRFHNAWVNLGIAYRLNDQFDQAESCYAKALALEPDYPELHVSMGVLFVLQGKYDEAVGHLERAAALNEHLPTAWSNLAVAYAAAGRFAEADAALKKAVVLGYDQGPQIQERIDSLRALAEGR